MIGFLEEVISKIEILEPRHGKKLRKNIKTLDLNYFTMVNSFIPKYKEFLKDVNKTLDFGIESYLRMSSDVMYEQIRFTETGKYSNSSFEEVNKIVYSNPEVMEYYMHGLLLSQILWTHHYKMFSFFTKYLPDYKNKIKNYLEVGGGHGLFISEAIKILNQNTGFDLVDISSGSINIAKKFIQNDKVNYILSDILKYKTDKKYDFITMGEVLEHVEEPLKLLNRLIELLDNKGHIYITVPANGPTIDHIYLFRNADEIRELLKNAGLKVVKEVSIYAEDVSQELAEELKITLMYGAFLEKA
jgi:2-polyprenyl-3-methyl-5-hydroxy-6-metoxy-1,4-benzoquinol methylase